MVPSFLQRLVPTRTQLGQRNWETRFTRFQTFLTDDKHMRKSDSNFSADRLRKNAVPAVSMATSVATTKESLRA